MTSNQKVLSSNPSWSESLDVLSCVPITDPIFYLPSGF